MVQPRTYGYGEEWEAEEMFGGTGDALLDPLEGAPESAVAEADEVPPDPAIDERDLLDEPPS